MGRLTGKVALVTGGSRGIGRGIAERLAEEGASLAIGYASRSEPAEEVLGALRQHHAEAMAVRADLADIAQVGRMVEQVAERFGRIDILVSNAGVEHFGSLEETQEEDFDRVFAVNTRGQFFAVQKAIRHMGSGGRIVCSSSMSATIPFPRHAVYAASKAAVEAMVKNLAVELGPRGITVNAVSPGPIWTDMAKQHSEEYLRMYQGLTMQDIIRIMVPMGRLGKPMDVASIVSFLVSEEAEWITGQTIHVDGGTH